MKSLAKILEKGNITPRERIMIVIKNSAHLIKTGEHLFEEDELDAISQQWKTTSNAEVNEYNKYLEFWKSYKHLRIDMQTLFLNVQIENANIEKILTLFYYNKEMANVEDVLKQRMKENPNPLAKEYILENTGIEYEALLHTYTFLSLPKKIQKDLEVLDQYIKGDYYYLRDEEGLAEILRGKKGLDNDDEKKIVDLVINSMRWDHEDIFSDNRTLFMRSIFTGYFASMPFRDIGDLVAQEHGIDCEDDIDLYEQLARVPDIKKVVRKVLKEEVKDGLFTDYYIPLCNSKERATYSGDTKMTHKEIMSHWLSAKKKVKEEIDQYIQKGVLTLKKKTIAYNKTSITYNVVLGTGLYHTDESLPFVADYKKQVEPLFIYGYLFKEIAESDVYKNVRHLYAYKQLCQKISYIVNVDLVPDAQRYIDSTIDAFDTHNLYIRGITSNIEDKVYVGLKYDFYIQSLLGSFVFDANKTKPVNDSSLDLFEDIASTELGHEWESLDSRKDLFSINP